MSRIFLAFLALALLPLQAHAYFDPGAGVVMLQVLIAASIGVIYKLRTFFARLLQAVMKVFKR